MVLGIENHTENWKTASCLAPLFGDRKLWLAQRLGEPSETKPWEVRIELFWKGMRDYRDKNGRKCDDESLVKSYRRLFQNDNYDLRERIETFGEFRVEEHNYRANKNSQHQMLVTNLRNTEIDIVLESPSKLYVGEAKYKGTLHANGRYVLVHQLVRQYVMAKILIDQIGCDKEIVHFVVGANSARGQVRFMISEGWMDETHVLSWEEVQELA